MPLGFAEIAFTPAVQAEQARYGSAEAYSVALDPDRDGGRLLGLRESAFIAARDSMFQATVSETGWPYVQHRGGQPGFLRVLDAQTIGYADLSGNRQYISTGNLRGNDRVSLILVDWSRRKRLKIWGRAVLVEDAEVIRQLQSADQASAERAVLIRVEAFDWNCPQHLPLRFTAEEYAHIHAEDRTRLERRIQELETRLTAVGADLP